MKPIFRPLLILLSTVLIGFLVLLTYKIHFAFSYQVLLLGLITVISALIFLLFCSYLAFFLPHSGWQKYWVLFLSTIFVLYFTCLYLLAFASNHLWGGTLSFETIQSFVIHSASAANIIKEALFVNLSPLALILSSTFVLVVFLLLSLCIRWLSQAMFQIANFLYTGDRPLFATLLLIGLVYASIMAMKEYFYHHQYQLYGEPNLSFFSILVVNNLTNYDNKKLKEMVEDNEALLALKRIRPKNPKNVILIFLDSLRADHLPMYGYHRNTAPFLQSLYNQGKLGMVEMSLAICPDSFCGITTTLSSRPFYEVSVANFKLYDLLYAGGYQINFLLSGDHRGWSYLMNYYGQKIHSFVDHKVLKADSLDDGPLIKSLDTLQPYHGEPNFFYFFLMTTHFWGKKLPEYKQFTPASLPNLSLFDLQLARPKLENGILVATYKVYTKDEMALYNNIYDNGIVQGDAYIEKIFSTLSRKGYLKNSLVVITADHGEALGEHAHVGHNLFLYQEDIRIPILIYDSEGLFPMKVPFGTNLDIAPTIASALQLPVPSIWRGKNLFKHHPSSLSVHQTHRTAGICLAVIAYKNQTIKKFVRCQNKENGFDEMLFNISLDPFETNNLLQQEGNLKEAKAYRAILDQRFGSQFVLHF